MTISEFCEQRFLRYHAVSPGTRQEYGYLAKNHIVPYIGHLRISEVNRETFFNLLVNVLPAEEASQITIRATRKVLSAMCQMAFDEGYRDNNPIRSIRLKHAQAKPVLVASHDQWRRREAGNDLSSRQAVRAAQRHHVGAPLRDDRFPPVRLRLRAAAAECHTGQPSTSTLSTTPRGRRDGSPSRIRRTVTGAGSPSPSRCARRYRNISRN